MAQDWQRGFQRPEKFDVVPVVELGVEPQQQRLNVVTRFPNSCYQGWNSFKEVDGNRVTLYHIATYPKNVACSRIVSYNDIVYDLHDLSPGTYQVIDGEDGTVMARIEKKNDSLTKLSPK